MVASPASFFMAASGGQAPFDSTLIGNSIWLEGSRTSGDAMTRTWGAESNQDRWIWATWYQPLRVIDAESKRNNLFASGSSSNGFYLNHTSTSSTFNLFHRDNAGSEGAINTTEQYRDTTSWIHVLVDYDSANANAENRISLYVNGIRTGVNSGNRPGQNNHINVNVQNQTARIGQDLSTTPDYHMQGYLAQTVFLDNKSIANSDLAITDFLDTFTFGTNGSQIVPKADADIAALATTAGGNSFCLDFSVSSDLGNDASSNNNDFSTSTIATANQSLHSPSKVYATWNALDSALDGHNADMTLSDGGTVTEDGNGAFCRSTFAIPEGLFSYRVTVNDSENSQQFGVALNTAVDLSTGTDAVAGLYTVSASTGYRNTNGSGSSAVSGYSWSDNDTMEVYVSRSGTTYKIWYGKNGTLLNNSSGSQGDPSAGSNELFSFTHTEDVFFGVHYVNPGTKKATTDFGQRGYSPAEGALTLSTPNLLTPSYQGIDYFDTTLYEGNGAGQRVGDFVPYTDLYTVNNSIIFDPGTKNHLQRTMSAAASDSNKKFTLSAWAKRVSIDDTYAFSLLESTDSGGGNAAGIRLHSTSSGTGTMAFYMFAQGSGVSGSNMEVRTTLSAVQTSSWQHFFIQVDTTQSTASDRVKLYVDGVLQTEVDNGSGSAAVYPDQNAVFYLGDNDFATQIGKIPYGAYYSSMYIAEHAFLTGTNSTGKTISDFGAVDTATNRWVPKDISGFTFGHNGHYLEFQTTPGSGNGAGTDTSGNSNHFAEAINNSASAWSSYTFYQTIDAPTKNFAVMNPGDQDSSTATTLSDGNLKVSMGTAAGDGIRGTLPYNGKMYWEVELDSVSTNSGSHIGIATKNHNLALVSDSSSNTNAFVGVNSFSGDLEGFIHNSLFKDIPYAGLGTNFATAGKFLMFAVDIDAGKFWAGYDGTFFNSGNPAAGTNDSGIDLSAYDEWFPAINRIGSVGSEDFIFNFGQRSFAHTPPTGFSNLNQDNLDDTASKITAWAWIKNRDADDDHVIVDRARGVGKVWESNTNTAAFTNDNTVQRFLQRGVQIGNDVTVNTSGESYVLWQWLVGDSATTGSTTSPAGTIPSTTIVSDASHFSVGTYTGDGDDNETIGHGLGGIPEMIIVRNLSRTTFGLAWHTNGGGANHTVDFAQAQAFSANSAKFGGSNGDNPTANVFTIGTHNEINANGESFVFYALRSVPGVCKVGAYIGNGDSTDGPYISLGFTPRYILIKNIGATQNWMIWDTARSPYNQLNNNLWADIDSGESTSSTYGRDIYLMALN